MNAKRDQNRIAVGLGVSSGDGVTVLPLNVDSVTGRLLGEATSDSLVPTSLTEAKRDENFKTTLYGVSSVDNETLVPIRTDEDGNLLADFM